MSAENTNAGGGETLDQIASAYEARVAAVPEVARRFAEDTWGKTWAHAEMGSLLDFAALSAQSTGRGGVAAEPVAGTAWIRAERDRAVNQRDMALEALRTLGVRLGVLDDAVACDGPQLLTAMGAYSDHLAAAPTPPAGGGETDAWELAEERKRADLFVAKLNEAEGYATRLAQALSDKHFPNPDWRPLPDLYGLLTQIDNMTTGLTRRPAPADRGETQAVGDGWQIVPTEPTKEMLVASNLALSEHIASFTKEQRGSRWGKPHGDFGYRVPSREKATVRYRAMLAAAPSPDQNRGEPDQGGAITEAGR